MRQFVTNRRNRRIAIVIAFVALGLVLPRLVAASGGETADSLAPTTGDSGRALTVSVETVKSARGFSSRRAYTGRLEAGRTSRLAFERVGVLTGVMVDEGAIVSKGAVLAQLDVRELTLDRTSAVAERDGAAATMQEMVAGPRQETIEAARAVVRDLEAQLELSKRKMDRRTALAKRSENAIAAEKIEEAEFQFSSARARLARGRHVVAELEAGTRAEKIATQEALVRRLEARIALIDLTVEKSTLRAPFAGTIASRSADEGAVVSPNEPVLVMVETGVMEARIGLPTEEAARVKPGAEIEVVVAGTPHKAVLRARHPRIDVATRTQLHIFRLVTAAPSMVHGQVARLELDVEIASEGIWLPHAALTRAPKGLWACYVVEEGRVARREVQILHTDGSRVFVRGTLRDGDTVIRSGAHRVVPGQLVTVKD
jgi:RND family efflux transporter MFP subunit